MFKSNEQAHNNLTFCPAFSQKFVRLITRGTSGTESVKNIKYRKRYKAT